MGAKWRGNSAAVQIETVKIPFHAHQEERLGGILVLVGVQDVGLVGIQKIGDGSHETLAIRASDQQNGGVPHVILHDRRFLPAPFALFRS